MKYTTEKTNNKQTIYLHIGTPKTGTSAIQSFLLENTEELKRQGYIYPNHSVDINDISSGNGEELLNLIEKNKDEEATLFVDNLVNKDKDIILSSESFYRYPELVHKIIPNAKIIVYFREQLQQIQSSYNQSIKRHYQTNHFNKALNQILKEDDPFFSKELIQRWSNLYGKNNVIFRVYESSSFVNKTIFSDFMYSIGGEFTTRFKLPKNHINISYCRDALEYKLLLNNLITNNEEKILHEKIDEALQKYSQEEGKKKAYSYSLYDNNDREKVYDFYKETNEWLAINVAQKDTKVLFKDLYINDIAIYPGLSKKKINQITRYIINIYPETLRLITQIVSSGLKSENINTEKASIKLVSVLKIERKQTFSFEILKFFKTIKKHIKKGFNI